MTVYDLTPTEWFDLLNERFTARTKPVWQDGRPCPTDLKPRNKAMDTLWSYYVGDPPLPQVAEKYRDIFREEMRKARCNYAPMCVGAMLDRMELQAVSTDQDRDTNGDDLAARIMDESGFAARFKDCLAFMFGMSESFAMVVPGDPLPSIYAIDPRRCVGIPDPLNPVRLCAALVREYDPVLKTERAFLFLPGEKWELRLDDNYWRLTSDEAEQVTGIDHLGGVPIVRFENANGLGEYEPHIDLLDRINDTTLQRMVLTKYQSFRQRAVVLEDSDEDDEDGEEPDLDTDALAADPGSLWVLRGATFWESNQADLTPIITAKRDDVKEFAAVTSTPLHLITPDAANGSAEGAALMRESATSKIRDRRARVTPPLKLLWRIAFSFAGSPERTGLRLHWGPIEFRSLAEKGSASAQAQAALSTERILTDIWEMSPQDAAQVIQQRMADALLAGPPVTNSDRTDQL
ncbi:phage portal protein [Gordonia alkanivorans]|uniref:Phage portal protein n=1 Tax=Gordonia alkanivorans NBRC 16433 TaxID=1027371 RepID=F9VYZ9_9ACTN|nr:phage portal protein [Gordonia alkanivorans]GAA13838.1 hypothetical protein GOALK_093_00260 [Gordonia alkanivorans NBRC 16433]